MNTPVGTRVIALESATHGVVRSYGEGVYAGDFPVPEDHPMHSYLSMRSNPRIDLDNGKHVWGFECWWGPADEVKAEYPEPEWKWESVDIDEARLKEKA